MPHLMSSISDLARKFNIFPPAEYIKQGDTYTPTYIDIVDTWWNVYTIPSSNIPRYIRWENTNVTSPTSITETINFDGSWFEKQRSSCNDVVINREYIDDIEYLVVSIFNQEVCRIKIIDLVNQRFEVIYSAIEEIDFV